MVKGDKFTFNCGEGIGIKDFTVSYIWQCNPICGGNTLYCVDKDLIEYCFLERDDIVYRFIKCLDEENRLDMLQREFRRNKINRMD